MPESAMLQHVKHDETLLRIFDYNLCWDLSSNIFTHTMVQIVVQVDSSAIGSWFFIPRFVVRKRTVRSIKDKMTTWCVIFYRDLAALGWKVNVRYWLKSTARLSTVTSILMPRSALRWGTSALESTWHWLVLELCEVLDTMDVNSVERNLCVTIVFTILLSSVYISTNTCGVCSCRFYNCTTEVSNSEEG